ncbi:transmembrane protein 44 isoform X2 [Ranitomeya imitator]|uniref:transmembrane protein 44 isoform X2 n=1 Tax=Ranitomeya imitator TaxID=111125 RepID=UPI0037E74D84
MQRCGQDAQVEQNLVPHLCSLEAATEQHEAEEDALRSSMYAVLQQGLTVEVEEDMDRVGNITVQEGRDPGLWNLDYLIACFAEDKICVSFGLWLLSCLFWFTSFSLHFYLRCKRKSSYEESVFWNIYGFFGSMCNTIGALLSKQLTIQIITGAYMALSDVIGFVLTLFPACNSSFRVRIRNSRRKQKPVFSALSISILISLGYCYSLVENDLPSFDLSHAPRRRLLGTTLQENTDVVGFTLGIVAVLVSWTVKVPVITRVCKGQMFPVIRVWAVLFSALASLMYAAAIMSHDRRSEYFVKAIPWFLISMGAAALDVALVFLSCIMKNKLVQQLGLVLDATLNEESCELLAVEEQMVEGARIPSTTTDAKTSNWTPLNMAPNRYLSKNDMRAVRLPGDGQTTPMHINHQEPVGYLDLSVYPPPCITHSTNSPSCSSDASSNTTDLEWDFEDLDQNWRKDSEFPCIQPNDSCVLKAINITPEQPISSTIWQSFKNPLSSTSNKNTQCADLIRIEQR